MSGRKEHQGSPLLEVLSDRLGELEHSLNNADKQLASDNIDDFPAVILDIAAMEKTLWVAARRMPSPDHIPVKPWQELQDINDAAQQFIIASQGTKEKLDSMTMRLERLAHEEQELLADIRFGPSPILIKKWRTELNRMNQEIYDWMDVGSRQLQEQVAEGRGIVTELRVHCESDAPMVETTALDKKQKELLDLEHLIQSKQMGVRTVLFNTAKLGYRMLCSQVAALRQVLKNSKSTPLASRYVTFVKGKRAQIERAYGSNYACLFTVQPFLHPPANLLPGLWQEVPDWDLFTECKRVQTQYRTALEEEQSKFLEIIALSEEAVVLSTKVATVQHLHKAHSDSCQQLWEREETLRQQLHFLDNKLKALGRQSEDCKLQIAAHQSHETALLSYIENVGSDADVKPFLQQCQLLCPALLTPERSYVALLFL